MAIVQCPECGKDISDQAASCPNCGMPRVPDEQQDSSTVVPRSTPKVPFANEGNAGLPMPAQSDDLLERAKRNPNVVFIIILVSYLVLAYVSPMSCGVVGLLATMVFLVGAVVAMFRKGPVKARALLALLSLVMGIIGVFQSQSGIEADLNYNQGVQALENGDLAEAERRFSEAGDFKRAPEKLVEVQTAIAERYAQELTVSLDELEKRIEIAPCQAETQAILMLKEYNNTLKGKGEYSELGAVASRSLERARTAIDAQDPDGVAEIGILIDNRKLDEAHAAFAAISSCARRSRKAKKVGAELEVLLCERKDSEMFEAAQAAHRKGSLHEAEKKLKMISGKFSLRSDANALLFEVQEVIRVEEKKKAKERALAEAESNRRAEEQRRARERAEAEVRRQENLMEWEKPWASVKHAAVRRCATTFEDYQLQAVCMQNEKAGYKKMQGDFGLPSSIARKAKSRCQRTFDDFQLQAVCVDNEKQGYNKMKTY